MAAERGARHWEWDKLIILLLDVKEFAVMEDFTLLLDAEDEDEHLKSTLASRLVFLLDADMEDFVRFLCVEEEDKVLDVGEHLGSSFLSSL